MTVVKNKLMNPIQLGSSTFYGSLIALFIFYIAFIVYNRTTNTRSFKVTRSTTAIIIQQDEKHILFNAVLWFIYFTIFSIFITCQKDFNTALSILIVIYLASLILALLYYIVNKRYKITIDLVNKLLYIKRKNYSLDDISYIIKKKRFDLSRNADNYGLFIKMNDNKQKLLYGYYSFSDIEALKDELEFKELMSMKD